MKGDTFYGDRVRTDWEGLNNGSFTNEKKERKCVESRKLKN